MAESSGTIPPALLEKPHLFSSEVTIWNAYVRLSSRRPVSGFGAVGAIPYSEIAAYLDLVLHLDDEEQAEFIELIEALDSAFLSDYADKKKAEAKRNEAKASTKTRTRS